MPLTQVSSRLIEDTLRYVLGASGTDHYTFTGKGLNGAVNDPTLTLSRGHTYIFENRNSNGAHPFYIKTSLAGGGTNNAYNTGVTNNGGAGGTEIVFTVPHDAPDVLYYQCSSHSSMAGQLKIAGAVADGSITESKLADDAVTEDKLANSINSAIAANTAKDLTALSASNLTSGTIPDARFPATLPAVSGANLTGISTGANPNLIINGAMEIQQRAAGTYTDITSDYTQIDRYHVYAFPASKLTYEPSTDAPVGFTNSFKITSTSAYTPTSGNYFYFGQRIEGHNWQHLEYGTSNAKTVTISFWVKSSITGTWSGIIKNNSQDRTFPWEYTISSANTWEKKTITVAGCPDGTWLTDRFAAAWIYFCMGSSTSGTTYLGSANSWQSQNLIGTTGSNSLPNTNGATWYMTGLKVEEGSTATDFQRKLYSQELADCMRYYQIVIQSGGGGAGNTGGLGGTPYSNNSSVYCPYRFPVEMRAEPTVESTAGTGSGSGTFRTRLGNNYNFNSFSGFNDANHQSGTFITNGNGGGGNVGQYIWIETNAGAKLALDAEL